MSCNVMPRENYYKILFRAAAMWNWSISVAAYLGNAFDETLFRSILPRVEPGFIFDMAILPTFLFGFAFWWVSQDLTRNNAVVAVGAAGSILAFVSILVRALTDDISLLLLPAGIIDLVFGVLMLEFLLWAHRNLRSHDG
jgi:hypothetical protein